MTEENNKYRQRIESKSNVTLKKRRDIGLKEQ